MDSGDFFVGSGVIGSSITENDNFSTPSAGRIRMKRELAFALKSHAELSELLGPRRLRKPPSPPFPDPKPSPSAAATKKRGRKKSSELFSADVRFLKTSAAPVLDNPPARVPVLARAGLSAETPIVVDDVDVSRRAVDNVSAQRRSVPDLVVPGWLEQQVSRITRAGNKYVMQGMEEDAFDVSGDAPADIACSHASISNRLSSPESVLDSIESTSRDTPHTGTGGKITRKDVGLHKLVFMEDVLPEGTMLQYMVNGITKLVGYAKDSGIFCSCCNAVVSPSQFEAHAGQAQRRKPYNYIYTSNGVSLHELSIILSKRRKLLDSQNDDLCSICEDAGELVLCDLCPRAFHQACAELSSVPEGDWHCKYCENMHQRENYVKYNDNARAAGRVVGVDAIDQIMKRCILIVKIPDSRVGGCALCRCKDYAKSVFGERTVLICDQCEKEYHVGCLKIHGMGDLKEKPEGDWFCCVKCITIHATLQYVLSIGAQELPIQALDVIKRNSGIKSSTKDADVARRDVQDRGDQSFPGWNLDIIEKSNCSERSIKDANVVLGHVPVHGAQTFPEQVFDDIEGNNSNERSIRDAGVDLKWRLFRGKTASANDKVFLSDAVSVLHESFDPIISGKKGTDLFTQLVFGRSWCHMDLQGMYCAVLIANSVVVSVSVLRVLGSDVAEVPLVATRKDCQGQGYFAALFACIGRLLASLNVEHLVLPATDDAQAMWTQKFGFTKISLDQLHSLARGIKIVDFEGTKLLHRTVSDLLPPFENRGC
ncbi:hypothetical protein KSP39_PZI015032 [Platanthera zijinensis]|uniref:PHD-type domain-containing protein n=1 Tax=Platanthera zijinensis TaxID=2320716 RepID=A0AAP0G2H1_9ASPA